MFKRRTLVLALVALLILGTVPWAVTAADPVEHTVKWGESTSAIAWMYGISVKELMEANDLNNANVIYQGDKLVIPGTSDVGLEHEVEAGESLLTIAADYGVTVWEIARRNGMWNINLVIVGDTLIIPVSGDAAEDPAVDPGEEMEPQAQEAIIITSPQADEEITSPVMVKGWGSAYENSLAVDVLNEMGAVIGQGYVVVDAELGQSGVFTGTIEFTPPDAEQMGRVSVYSISARDGAIEHLSSVTVKLP